MQKLIEACGGKEAAKHVIDNVTTLGPRRTSPLGPSWKISIH